MIRARNVSPPAGSRTHSGRSLDHGVDDIRVLAHAEVVVEAPNHDTTRTLRGVPDRPGKSARNALEVRENAVAPRIPQPRNRVRKKTIVVHASASPGQGPVSNSPRNDLCYDSSLSPHLPRETRMAFSFARSRHKLAQRIANAFARRVGVEGAHELPAGIHQVEIGTVVDDVVPGARPGVVADVIGSVFLGDRGGLLRIADETDDPWVERLGVFRDHFERVSLRIDGDKDWL